MNAPNLSSCSEPEKKLLFNVILPVLEENAHKYIFPQYKFAEKSGKIRKIDFAIITENTKIAIELDGYTYHAEGVVSEEKFSDDLQRQNELILDGWKVIRFSWNQLLTNEERCRDYIRRLIISDPLLHPSLKSANIKPHIIQLEVLERLKNARDIGVKKGLVVMATGLGKTYLSAFDAKRVGGKILFIVHNNSILEQAMEAYRKIFSDKTIGLYNGYAKEKDADIVFANISTLRNDSNIKQFNPEEFTYIIIDEFHHGATYNYMKVISYFKPKFLLGLTATPNRTDRKSILSIVDNNLIYQITQQEAIQRGFLVPFYYYALQDNVDYSNIKHNGFRYNLNDLNRTLIIRKRDELIIDKYREITGEAKAIAFCVSVDHALRAAEHFKEAGIPAKAIHSRMTQEYRRQLIEEFRNDEYKVVFVRDIFNEGIDFPDVETLIFMRPTESKIVFTQQLGRGLRLSENKKAVKVLDFIGNYINADKIINYLGDYGNGITINTLKEKPTFYYDSGCQIEFDEKALDTIAILSEDLVTDIKLIESFFSLCNKLGRAPTILEIQSLGQYKIKNYMDTFGNWDKFVERIRTLEPELDVGSLDWPAKFRNIEVEEYADMLEKNSDEFNLILKDIYQLFVSIKQLTISLGDKVSPRQKYEKLNSILLEIQNKSKMAEELLNQVSLILSFKFSNPLNINQDYVVTEKDSNVAEKVIKNLKPLVTKKETFIYPRYFFSKISLMESLLKLIDEYNLYEELNEVETLEKIYSIAFQNVRFIKDINSYLDMIIKWMDD